MRDFVEEDFEVAGVADCLGHLGVGVLVVGGEDLLCELREVVHLGCL